MLKQKLRKEKTNKYPYKNIRKELRNPSYRWSDWRMSKCNRQTNDMAGYRLSDKVFDFGEKWGALACHQTTTGFGVHSGSLEFLTKTVSVATKVVSMMVATYLHLMSMARIHGALPPPTSLHKISASHTEHLQIKFSSFHSVFKLFRVCTCNSFENSTISYHPNNL